MRRAPLLLAVPLVAGCSSTQSQSARLKAQADNRPGAKPFVVAKANPKVRFGPATVLSNENGTAVVLPVRAQAALTHVPLSFELLARGGKRVYRNDTPGLDTSLVEVPVLERGQELLWVDDQIVGAQSPVKARAKAGRAKPLAGPLPKLALGALHLEGDPTEGVAVKGSVHNRSQIEQRRVVVYLVARRGKQITAAGRAVVPRLKVGKTAKFTAFLIGDSKGARITAAAPPTTLR